MTSRKKPPINHKSLERFEGEGGTTRAGELSRKKRPRDANQLAKSIVDIATGETEDREPTPEEQGKDPAAVSLGRRGGLKGGKSMAKRKKKPISQAEQSRRFLQAAREAGVDERGKVIREVRLPKPEGSTKSRGR